jgi:hypothetical protein
VRLGFVCRAIRQLHRETSKALEVDRECLGEVERLLNELQQLLVGISIMQVCPASSLTLGASGDCLPEFKAGLMI